MNALSPDPDLPLPLDLGANDCVYFTRFRPDPAGDGGQRRAAQIVQLLEPWRPRLVNVAWERPPWTAFDRALFSVMGPRFDDTWGLLRQQLMTSGEFRQWSVLRQRFVWLLRTAARSYAKALRTRGTGPRLAILDDPMFVHPLARQLKAQGVPLVGICHNLESLNRWQVAPQGQLHLLGKELSWLQACDLVITISQEETFLLRNLAVPVAFLRYYPVEAERARLRALREARRKSAPTAIVMLGSCGNRSTLEGMAAAIRAWHAQGLTHQGFPLRVIGFGTEALKPLLPADCQGVELLGSLSAADLDRELIGALACMCHQEDGAGALTRIMDLLVAGVPVLASEHAARSYLQFSGVYTYAAFDEIATRLAELRAAPRDVPLPEPPKVDDLHRRLAALAPVQS